jgi:HK97 family phage prohead protease
MTTGLIEYRHIPSGQIEQRFEDETASGTFSGYACRWDVVDSYGTRFKDGSWTAGGLDEDHYGFLFMHDPKIPIGVFRAREDDEGLWIEGVFDETTDGKDARTRAKSGSASELSVGFVRTGVDPDDNDHITSARLVEVSLITRRMASQPKAELAAVRSAVEFLENSEDRANKHKCTNCGKFVTKSYCDVCTETRDAEIVDSDLPEPKKDNGTFMDEKEDRKIGLVAGSYEERIRLIDDAVSVWAAGHYNFPNGDWYSYVQATFADSAVATVTSYGPDKRTEDTWRFQYEVSDDRIVLSNPSRAEIVATVRCAEGETEARVEETTITSEPEDTVVVPDDQESVEDKTVESDESAETSIQSDGVVERKRALLHLRIALAS